jgi:hypothetical protein
MADRPHWLWRPVYLWAGVSVGLAALLWSLRDAPLVIVSSTSRSADTMVLSTKPLVDRFTIKNCSRRVVQLTAEHRYCGCTELKTDAGPVRIGQSIPVGGVLQIFMQVDPRGRRGRSEFVAGLTLSDGARSENVQLRVSATVQEPLVAQPEPCVWIPSLSELQSESDFTLLTH